VAEDVVVGRGLAIRIGPHGRGVFATRRFARGATVEVCPTLELPDGDVTGLLGDYVFRSNNEDAVLLLLGFGMLYNHSGDPNLEYVEGGEPGTIEFVTMRKVEAGEELTIDYGAHWWEERGLEPD
jgi:hypothetical protein